jgi:uncharacterized protein YecE (DUF72 family)
MPRTITHDAQLRRTRASVEKFLGEVKGLGKKLGPLLIQLPPSLEFDARVVSRFFGLLRELHRGAAVCEPRHRTWFDPRAEGVLLDHGIGRVAADPPVSEIGGRPGAVMRVIYHRLHGSPRMYWSNYSRERLFALASEIRERSDTIASWIIFDNTAGGCAAANALQLTKLLSDTKR